MARAYIDGEFVELTAEQIAAAVWAWWKNNSFTENAIAADEYKDMLNNGGEGKENA